MVIWVNIKKNDDMNLKIDDFTVEGSAVGHYDGVAVFVRGAVPGDEIIAHIIKVSKKYCIGIVKEIVVKSPYRIESDCPVSDKCGGCSFRNVTYQCELEYKKSRVEQAIRRIGHIDIDVEDIIGADRVNRYRNKAQYPVVIDAGNLTSGFYAYKSHRIIPCNNCLLQSEDFSQCIDTFSKWVKESGVTSYDENSGSGILRHIYLRKAFATGEISACAVVNANSLPNADLLIKYLTQIDGVKSVSFNVNKDKTNVILGKNTYTLWGADYITEILLGKKFAVSPNSFFQVNPFQCEKLYKKAAEYANLSGNDVLVDLYCGAGTIGLTMADKAKAVYGIEVVPQAVENARLNANLNDIKNAEFMCCDAYEGAERLAQKGVKPDVVILDPPRKGCQRELFDVIEKMSPKRIVYVSCDSATLARDLALLKEKNYITKAVTPVDMFPRTPHVEAVALIEKI